ncbi:uncharacterized protein C8Q71DRAFT_183142 [Rhodofomes roseus]|uniref:CFEM domain-containing protein n=1 Tax=Rhodofomes roseus TaxID=34475 RepID=A0ABQ8K905_9APHY|nr:uncharacterized protein C8Q71DRAFT_183142 [Rhodofomes roseus]KAH9833440.1 hypothetical protein C8Q71DRAFT_183142 [Rhodofomes roseus]
MFSTLPSSLLLAVSAALSFVQVGAQSTSGSTTVQVTISGSSSFGTTVPPSSSASANGSGSLSGSATSTASLPSFSGYSACVDNCIDSAVAFTGCSSVADVDCFCGGTNSTAFAQNLTSCMANYCPSSIGSAESLANQFCAVASPSTSISFATTSLPSTTSASATNTSSSASRSASRSATSSSTSASATTSTSAGMRLGADSKVVVTMAAGLVMAALGVLSAL